MKIIPMSIVIPTYNRTKVLFDTIESLNAGEYVPDEVIVVDQTNPPVEFPEKLKTRMGNSACCNKRACPLVNSFSEHRIKGSRQRHRTVLR